MLFLVTAEYIDAGYLVPPDASLDVVEQAVVPSFQILGGNDRVTGGVYAGERAGAFMIEVDSPEDLDRFMNVLPFFGLCKWTVKSIVPFQTMAQQVPQYIAQQRSMMQGGGAPS